MKVLPANVRFDLWLASPEMQKAEAAFRANDAFWAERREEGLRHNIAFVARVRRLESERLKERMEKSE